MQPEAVERKDAMQLLRELRLDHARYIEKIPEDWLEQANRILDSSPDPNRHKKKALLEKLRASVVRTRSGRGGESTGKRPWRETISLAENVRPFDLLVFEAEMLSQGQVVDLDEYLDRSEEELGSLEKTFSHPEDWRDVTKPIIHSDNNITIVDRYFDLGMDYYSKLFGPFLDWIADSRIRELRLFVGPNERRTSDCEMQERLNTVVDSVARLKKSHPRNEKLKILVFCSASLHKRYMSTKICGIELDYGFRLSTGRQIYKCDVLRKAEIASICAEFLTTAGGHHAKWWKSV